MKPIGIVISVCALLIVASLAHARGGRGGHGGTGHGGSHATRCVSCPRDAHGRIERSEEAQREFMRQTGYPNGRPGYVIDYIVPLKEGGCDCPANMPWQTIDAAKAKDQWE